MNDPEYKPDLLIDFHSSDGNVYVVLSKAVNAIRQTYIFNAKEKELELRERFKKAHDYEDALRIIGEYVTIVPLGGDRP